MSGIPPQADVVVIGGGPAGSTTANVLASHGYEVVLLDKALHPRPTVGESILPVMWKYADLLGATEALAADGFMPKSGGTVVWNGVTRQMRFSWFGYERQGLHVERDRFDAILLRTAEGRGARVFEGVAAHGVDLADRWKTISFRHVDSGETGTIRCRAVVDGSGQGAVIARSLGFREFDPDLRFMSAWGYFRETSYVVPEGAIRPYEERWRHPPTTLQAQIRGASWFWHILQRDRVSIGLVLAPDEMERFKTAGSTTEERFLRTCANVPLLADLVALDTFIPGSTEVIRDFAYHPRLTSGDGWFLAGDALAFVDPINSQGMLGALYTGYLAGLSVHETLRDPRRAADVRGRYDAIIKGLLGLYRLSALPPGTNSFPDLNGDALAYLKLLHPLERELLMVQMTLSHRAENLEALYELDPALDPIVSEKIHHVESLTRA